MLVGDYIHFRYYQYRENGLDKTGGKPPRTSQIFNNQRKTLLNNAILQREQKQKDDIKSHLEQQLNFFFNPSDPSLIALGYDDSERAAIATSVSSLCQQALGKIANQASIDWNNLSVKDIENISIGNDAIYDEFRKIRKTKLGGIENGKRKEASTKQAVSRRLKALMDLRNKLNSQLVGGSVDQDFITKLNAFEQQYKKIINPLIQSNNGINTQTKEGKSKARFSVSENKGFIRDLQDLIDDSKKITMAQVDGMIAEYVPVITQAVMANFTKDKIEDVIGTLNELKASDEITVQLFGKNGSGGRVKATDRTHKEVVSTKVRSKVSRRESNMSTEAQFDNATVKIGSTYDKVDVQLEIPNAQFINASVKNLSPGAKNIAVLTGRSSLQFLQDYPLFANHYLNVTAQHGGKREVDNGKTIIDSKPQANTVQMAHDTMRLTIALHALIGDTWGKGSSSNVFTKTSAAEIMVVNEQSKSGKGHFKVVFMSDIVKKIANNLDLVNIENFNEVHYWPNDWVSNKHNRPSFTTAYARIYNMLGNLHAQQLRVTIKKNALS